MTKSELVEFSSKFWNWLDFCSKLSTPPSFNLLLLFYVYYYYLLLLSFKKLLIFTFGFFSIYDFRP